MKINDILKLSSYDFYVSAEKMYFSCSINRESQLFYESKSAEIKDYDQLSFLFVILFPHNALEFWYKTFAKCWWMKISKYVHTF